MWDGMAEDIDLIWVRREWKYFSQAGWTGGIRLIAFDNLGGRRKADCARLHD
jgi:hypothetical protein